MEYGADVGDAGSSLAEEYGISLEELLEALESAFR